MYLETIPPLMNSLQIVWIISCHYNTNERMVPLMERIAWQLCERVAQVIDIHMLFKYVNFRSHLNLTLELQILKFKFASNLVCHC